jgi:anti-anti-sigma factor
LPRTATTHRPAASPSARFSCEVEHHGDTPRVVVVGELDVATAPVVDERLTELTDAGARRLVLDLRQVSFLDVQGVHLAVAWSDRARSGGLAGFIVIAGEPGVQRIFDLTRTTSRIAFADAATVPPARRRPLRRFARRRRGRRRVAERT